MCLVAAAGALAFALSPLCSIVAQRLDSPHTNDIRAFTVSATVPPPPTRPSSATATPATPSATTTPSPR